MRTLCRLQVRRSTLRMSVNGFPMSHGMEAMVWSFHAWIPCEIILVCKLFVANVNVHVLVCCVMMQVYPITHAGAYLVTTHQK